MKTSRVRLSEVQLRVYVYMLEKGRPLGVRELSRALDLPPSTVHYTLRRLEDLGLVASTPEGYRVSRLIDVEGFLYIRGRLVPRLLVYASFFLGSALGGLILIVLEGVTPERIALIITSGLAALLMGFEGLNARRRLLRGGPG
ncbi:MAG: helix-turn-helix domain-containing protein [Desulfurococcales archaeon]|nr:helix-turn-helix domain-containing protein [Desulfurococcales archaeon]